jgi:hypothetical protein
MNYIIQFIKKTANYKYHLSATNYDYEDYYEPSTPDDD